MRKYLINILLLMLIAFQVAAAPANILEQFNSANKFYQQKKYKEAVELYSQIEKSNNLSSNLYENMANAELQLGHIANALLYLEKAKKYSSNTEMIDEKIQTILSSQHLEYDQNSLSVSAFFAKKWSVNQWSIFAIVISMLLIFTVLYYFLSKNSLSIKVFAMVVCVGFLSVCLIHFFASKHQQILTENNWAIILKDKTELKNTPDFSSSTNYEVQAGYKFEVLDKIGNWYLLQNQFGKKGWAENKSIGLI